MLASLAASNHWEQCRVARSQSSNLSGLVIVFAIDVQEPSLHPKFSTGIASLGPMPGTYDYEAKKRKNPAQCLVTPMVVLKFQQPPELGYPTAGSGLVRIRRRFLHWCLIPTNTRNSVLSCKL